MQYTAVDKYAVTFMQFYFACSYKAECSAFGNKQEFQFMMPVPVNAVEVKLPNIFGIVCKRIMIAAMPDGFPQCLICGYLKNVHTISPHKKKTEYVILYHKYVILCND